MNPLVRRGQEHRPAQPTAPLTAEEIRECGPVLTRWQSALSRRAHSLSPPPFALLTYLTDSASLSPWVLGLSAAAHGVPIIVVGAGMKWAGAGVKLPAARRAAQAVAAHEGLRGVALVFADGSDTAIARTPSTEAAALLRDVGARKDAVLVSGECGSWPLCYQSRYRSAHAAFRQCAARKSPACYPNSGLYAGSAPSLVSFLSRLHSRASEPRLLPPERGDDQAALHALYQQAGGVVGGQAAAASSSSLRVDESRVLFGSLHACKGPGTERRLTMRGVNFSLCHEGAYEPLRDLGRRNGSSGSLLLHASGNHDRLARALLGEGYASSLHLPSAGGRRGMVGRASLVERSWRDYFYSAASRSSPGRRGGGPSRGGGDSSLLAHPVLMVDAAGGERKSPVCSIAPLGELIKASNLYDTT